MIDVLLAASISCMDGRAIIDRVNLDKQLTVEDKKEIIFVIKEAMDCDGR